MWPSIRAWLWPLAATLLLAAWQRYSGPTRPLPSHAELGGKTLKFRLARTHAGIGDENVRLASTAGLKGELSFRRAGSSEPWTVVQMTPEGQDLTGALPHQPVAGKLEYKIQLHSGGESAWVNEERPTVIRFRGEVSLWVLVPHVVCMFLGLLLAARAGLDAALGQENRKLVIACVTFLAVGGMILGPIVQKAAFGEYWTGWPFGPDLTDNKTVVAWIGWIVAAIARKPRYTVIAALATFVVFAIPHSVLSGNVAAAVQK